MPVPHLSPCIALLPRHGCPNPVYTLSRTPLASPLFAFLTFRRTFKSHSSPSSAPSAPSSPLPALILPLGASRSASRRGSNLWECRLAASACHTVNQLPSAPNIQPAGSGVHQLASKSVSKLQSIAFCSKYSALCKPKIPIHREGFPRLHTPACFWFGDMCSAVVI